MVILIKALQVILALSVLIIIHEFGHFLWARLFGIRVEKFYLFFDVGGRAIARWKWGDTEFGIGWLPFGGYCKISGMIDESLDTEQLKSEPKKWEFRTKPAWQRLLVMAGGVVNNFIFAVLVYIAIMAIWGQAYIENKDNSIYVNDLAYEMGFRNGDRILSFDDYVPENFGMLQADLARRDVHKATVLRGADTHSRPLLAELRNQDVTASVVRGGDTLSVPVKVDTAGRIGVYMQTPGVKVERYDILSAVPAGLRYTGETISGYLRDLKLLAQPSTGAYKSVGSFIAIGQVFPATWDWYSFLNILALLSIMLGVINLVPIPGLDGGHILFTLYEMVSGRKPGEKFLVAAQLVGMALIIGLMVLAIGNDIGRII